MNQAVQWQLLDSGVGLITFTRAEQLNTLNSEMLEGLATAYREFDQNDAVKVVVVTGSGAAFCAGADLSTGGNSFAGDGETTISSCPLSFQAWDVRKPVIAAVNGHAIGVGLGIALQADIRVLANEGKYGFVQNRRGVVADFACEYLLPRLVGSERAFEIIIRGLKLSGSEAVDWGLASRSVAADQVLATALEIAEDMAKNCAPLVMGLHKKLLQRGQHMELDAFVELETKALQHSIAQPDAMEGGLAFVEKRTPQWRGSVSRDWPGDFD